MKIEEKLEKYFPYKKDEREDRVNKNPIGIEIEIKWRYFFPELYEKYISKKSYSELNEQEKVKLTKECDELEKDLIEKFKKTEESGIKRGNDKYYEYIFPPRYNVKGTSELVNILVQNNLIPDGEHSIHVNIGNLRANKDAYYLLLMMELKYSSVDRLKSGFINNHKNMSATYGRKGYGGIFEKDKRYIELGSEYLSELRTLSYNPKRDDMYEMIKEISYYADIIIDKQNNKENKLIKEWDSIKENLEKLLVKNGLVDKNWKKPNLEPEYWEKYIEKYETIKSEFNKNNRKLKF